MENPLVIALISTAVLLLMALVITLWQRRSHAERIDQLESRATNELAQVQSEHSQRVERLTREWKSERKRAHLDLARDLLPALDAVESALENAAAEDEVTRGVELIRKELLQAFHAHGIERIAPACGEPFDPNLHEAVDVTEPTDEAPDGTVAACHRAGYEHPETVLRPAMVTVARG